MTGLQFHVSWALLFLMIYACPWWVVAIHVVACLFYANRRGAKINRMVGQHRKFWSDQQWQGEEETRH